MLVGAGRVGRLLVAVVAALVVAGCGGGGGDTAPPAAPDPAPAAVAYDFNGAWNLVTTVVDNACDREVFNGRISIVQKGTEFALTRMRNGVNETFRGTCDPAAKTFDFTYQDRYGTVAWHGQGVEEWRLDGWRTLPGPGNCTSRFTWSAVLESRN